jgi:signal transduction histidine kinase
MPNGGIIKVSAWGEDTHVTVEVQDSGVGIPKEAMAKLFLPFYTTKLRGTGLGLPFVKQTVEAHGGTISVASTTGTGTKFSLRIPVK